MTRALLVIDDNKSVRDSLKFLLQRRGYEVLVAENGNQALTLAAEHDVGGALIDVNMPGINGLQACRMLREGAAAKGRTISIWMMTGARTPQLHKEAAEAGALAVLGKPFDFAELFKRFEEAFGGAPELPKPDAVDQR